MAKFNNFLTFLIMSLTPWGAAIDATASHINLGAQAYFNHKEAKLQREWQSAENEKSRQFERDMWEASNQYNTPSAQRARLEDAGLNPYLTDGSGQVGTGTTQPMSAPAPASGTPAHSITPQSTNFAQAFAQMEQIKNQSKMVDAESANQYAQAAKIGLEVWRDVYKQTGDQFKASEAARRFMPVVYGANWESSPEGRQFNAETQRIQAKAEYDRVLSGIEAKYGYEKAQQINWNLQQQAAKTIYEMGLINKLDKVYDEEILLKRSTSKLNSAKVDEAIKNAYKAFSEGQYVESLKLTEDEKRDFFVTLLQMQAGEASMEFLSHEADFSEEGMLRDYKHTGAARVSKQFGYGLENNPATNIVDYVGNRARVVLSDKPARAVLKRKQIYSENGLNQRGYKTKNRIEAYEYE